MPDRPAALICRCGRETPLNRLLIKANGICRTLAEWGALENASNRQMVELLKAGKSKYLKRNMRPSKYAKRRCLKLDCDAVYVTKRNSQERYCQFCREKEHVKIVEARRANEGRWER